MNSQGIEYTPVVRDSSGRLPGEVIDTYTEPVLPDATPVVMVKPRFTTLPVAPGMMTQTQAAPQAQSSLLQYLVIGAVLFLLLKD